MNIRQVNAGVILLTVLLAFCLLMVCRHLFQGEIQVHSEPNLDMGAVVKSGISKCRHQNVESFVLKDNETTSGKAIRLPVLATQRQAPTTIVSSSAADAFAMRHDSSTEDAAQVASDMNDVMDEMLNRSEIPADYAETMVALFRDKSRGDVIRDFAVQHIGLYAETLKNMRGKYDAGSRESAILRDVLFDAANETRTIVAAAAFRALADMSAFDPRIDASRLDNRLASCVADASSSPAARVMATQLCGERRVVSARASLATIAVDRAQPEPLRRAAANSAKLLAE